MSRRIIVALDGSSLADLAIPHALSLAAALGARLTLVRVHVPVGGELASGLAPAMPPNLELDLEIQATAAQWLNDVARQLRDTTTVPVDTAFRVGRAEEEIVRVAREMEALVIVCTTHGRGGWAPEWLGSVCDAVIRRARCPVLALGRAAAERQPGTRSILVPLEGSTRADRALPEATMLARAHGARLELFRAVAPAWLGEALLLQVPERRDRFGVDWLAGDAKASLDCLAAELRSEGFDVSAAVTVDSHPIRAVLARIRETDPDLIVVTTGTRGLSRLFMPSLGDRVLRAGGRATLFVHETQAPTGAWKDLISYAYAMP